MYQHNYTSLLLNFVSFQTAVRGLKIRVSDILAILRLTVLGAVMAQFQMKNLTRAFEVQVYVLNNSQCAFLVKRLALSS